MDGRLFGGQDGSKADILMSSGER